MKTLRLALVCAGVITLTAGCGPEFGDEQYTMSTPGQRSARGAADRVTARTLPSQALLASVKAPDCEAPKRTADSPTTERRSTAAKPSGQKVAALDQKTSTDANPGSAASSRQSPSTAQDTPPTELEMRIKLEYERACYKRAEAATRARLSKLQTAMRELVKRQQAAAP